ncbi:deoxyribonuclease V [Pseudoxanthomonas sp. PXM01]|uniref:deoxyribonuclease V n=1 Tax=Pseudoxanthomonas sp. PXM01 TaxID=2769295 RepID=UPI0017841C37|nr:deoxyribonuclease V [Pseudoxanthomonas sp. PXM01]MBD9469377.1 deoxyribonuclease V [Pseudoxanthomonas sp. PXM01]
MFGDWDGSIADARRLQERLATEVSLRDDVPDTPRWLAGFDVGFEDEGATTRAAAVLLAADTLQPIASDVVRMPTSMPYVPGLLSFRELPALVVALGRLPHAPDLAFIDGQGIAHPRRLGIAAHFGVVTGLPSIGVAKNVLCGKHETLGALAGERMSLIHRGDHIGWVLRSKPRCNPLIVSPGHRVSMQGALDWVLRTLRGYRLPEPTRLADRLASRRG